MKRFFLNVVILCIASASAVASDFTFTVPEGATVYAGAKTGGHYKPFTEKTPKSVTVNNGKTVYTFDLTGKHNYRVSKSGALTHVGVFTPGGSETGLEFTEAQLMSHSPKEIDRDVNSLGGRNVADIFLNINPKGFLKMTRGATHQLVPLRNWQAIDSDVNNYFIEPDYHYTVINETDADVVVVSVSPDGLITAVSGGTAIVLVTYDAMMCAHTTNTGSNGNAFFGALWPENTGIFVVSVDAPDSGITPNITINEGQNVNEYDKMALSAVDAELDVFYYSESNGGYDYTFKPDGAVSVELAQLVATDMRTPLQYNGFSTDGVTKNSNGSYTVRLKHGSNIVKLISPAYAAEYQIIRAKPVTYAVSNVTRPDRIPRPGDKVSILFNTLYHPCNKLSGVYNMTAGIQYTGSGTDFGLIAGSGQYTFASKAQTLEVTIPANYTGNKFTLTDGVIRVRGYGDHYGNHRFITLENGKALNMNAALRNAYFGSLPDIHIPMDDNTGCLYIPENKIHVYPNPFAESVTLETASEGEVNIYDLSGRNVLHVTVKEGVSRINTVSLAKGVYILKHGTNVVKIVK